MAIDRSRTPLASEDDLPQRPRYAHSLSGLRHRGGQPLAPLGERAGRRAYTGSGLYGDGDFWSGIVFGDSLTIEYLPDGASAGEAVPFQIVEISHIWDDAFGGGVEGGVRWPQGAFGSSDRRESLKPLPDRIDVAVGTPSKKARLTKATQAIPLVERSSSLQPPRRELTPGRPVPFRLGPFANPTLVTFGDDGQLEVPEDATRVTFTLESDANLALFVRYGKDTELQDGGPCL